MVGMLHEQTSARNGCFGASLIFRKKFAVTARRFPDTSKKYPVHEPREFVAKSLIVRTEVRARSAEQAVFGENSL
jgi:hypothetical protein